MAERWLAGLTACCALLAASVALRAGEPSPQAAIPSSTPSPERATLDRYCVSCHNSRARAGGLALDTADVARVGATAATWEKVVRKLRGRMMPPPGLPRAG